MACKHNFIGDSDGVFCAECGIRMTAEEYRSYLAGEAPRQDETVQQETHRRTRKAKESK